MNLELISLKQNSLLDHGGTLLYVQILCKREFQVSGHTMCLWRLSCDEIAWLKVQFAELALGTWIPRNPKYRYIAEI